MSQVKALSFQQNDCGRHLSDTKKKFLWNFQIDGKVYNLELINSALSGKKTVILNMEQIYFEKNLLNIDFDFTHMIQGHSFRIFRDPDNFSKFLLRVDNMSFEQLRMTGGSKKTITESKWIKKEQSDPFAEFGSFSSNNNNTKTTNNDNGFGDFDFDNFSKKPSNQFKTQTQKTAQQNKPQQQSLLMDFNFNQTKPINDFQTNAFQTNNLNNFANKFNNFQKDLLNQDSFSTNAYQNRNHYLQLQQNKGTNSQQWSDMPAPQRQKGNFLYQNLNLHNFKVDITAKQAINKVSMKANQLKKAVKQYSQSLI